MEQILVINPGSTSTKIAVYDGEALLWSESISHSASALAQYKEIFDQLDMRKELILEAMQKHGTDPAKLSAIAARGGLLCSLQSGAYIVDAAMLDMLRYRPTDEHASNLAAALAYDIAKIAKIPSYIYDGVTVDEMIPVVRITGLKEINRHGQGHNLNMRAAAIKYCRDSGKAFNETNMIVTHLGGGISVSVISGGKIIDMVSDNDGPFAPERAGGLPCDQLVDLIFKNGFTKEQIMKKMKRSGGLVSHFGTSDSRDVEKMVREGDERAELVFKAMALSVSKYIAAMAATVNGRVDAIILTGGIAYSRDLFDKYIEERVSFIAPVTVIPGENEMPALAHGVLRVLRGEEQAHLFVETR